MGTTSSVESEMKENKMAKKEEKASDSQETVMQTSFFRVGRVTESLS